MNQTYKVSEGFEKKVWAEFLGWQLGLEGEKLFPLFNVRGEHARSGSTVTITTLQNLGIEVPMYQAA